MVNKALFNNKKKNVRKKGKDPYPASGGLRRVTFHFKPLLIFRTVKSLKDVCKCSGVKTGLPSMAAYCITNASRV